MGKMSYPNAGSLAAYLQAALWITFVLFIFVINPSLGLTTPSAIADPAALLPVLADVPALMIFPTLDLLVGLSLLLVVIGMDTALNGAATSQLMVLLGVMAALFFIILATSRLYTLPLLAEMYLQNPTGVSGQFIVLNAIHDGLAAAARLVLGLWLTLTNFELRERVSFRHFAYIGLFAGVVNTASTFIQPLAGLNMILLPVWFYLAGRWMFYQSDELVSDTQK